MQRGAPGVGPRLVGVDIARGCAIFGMLWVHFAPDATGYTIADGRSAILFATLAGVSLGLLTGGPNPPAGRSRLAGYRTIAVRGVVLLVLGRLLVLLGTPIAVILDYYGVLFLVFLLVLFAPRWVVAAVGVLAWTAGGWLVQEVGPDPAAAFASRNPAEWPEQWFVTGLYPVVLYAGYAAAGLVAARSDLARRRTQLALVAVGAVLMPIGYLGGGALGVDAGPHADTTWEAIGSGGFALAVIGLLQLASGLRIVRTVLSPVADAGSMPLTIYTAQVIAAALLLGALPVGAEQSVQSWWALAAIVAGSLLFAVVWRRLAGRGPLEQLLALLSRAGRTVAPPASATTPRPVRTVLRGLLAAGIGAAAVLALSALYPAAAGSGSGSGAALSSARTIADARGTVTVELDRALLHRAGLEVAATGAGTRDGGLLRLPITGGQVQVTPTSLQGGLLLDGSGMSFTRGAAEIRVSNLVIDPQTGTVAADLAPAGGPPHEHALFAVYAVEAPEQAADGSGAVIVDGASLTLTDAAAKVMDDALGAPVFAPSPRIGSTTTRITDA